MPKNDKRMNGFENTHPEDLAAKEEKFRTFFSTSARSAKPGSGEGKPPRDPRNGGNLEAWDLTRVWRHGWIQADAPHDDVASAPSINDNRRKGH